MMDEVVDKAGRRVKLRRVGVLETLRLFKALGPDLSENNAYVRVAATVASVSDIDGVPVPFPVSEGAVEALIQRIGDETLITLSAAENVVKFSNLDGQEFDWKAVRWLDSDTIVGTQ